MNNHYLNVWIFTILMTVSWPFCHAVDPCWCHKLYVTPIVPPQTEEQVFQPPIAPPNTPTEPLSFGSAFPDTATPQGSIWTQEQYQALFAITGVSVVALGIVLVFLVSRR